MFTTVSGQKYLPRSSGNGEIFPKTFVLGTDFPFLSKENVIYTQISIICIPLPAKQTHPPKTRPIHAGMIITTITEVLWRAKKKEENKEKGKEEEEGGSKFCRGITIWTEGEELGRFSLFFLFFFRAFTLQYLQYLCQEGC